jgi:hypothetical protein
LNGWGNPIDSEINWKVNRYEVVNTETEGNGLLRLKRRMSRAEERDIERSGGGKSANYS